jgi:hypothetical protein
MTDLKLIALDAEDLAVLSANLQDAVLRVADLAYLKREKRFAAIANRFDWGAELANAGSKRKPQSVRRRCGLRFERVLGAKITGFDPKAKDAILNLLAIGFEPLEQPENPEGYVTLLFSGGAAIRLHVECVEAELKDLGAAWRARAKPTHPGDDTPGT